MPRSSLPPNAKIEGLGTGGTACAGGKPLQSVLLLLLVNQRNSLPQGVGAPDAFKWGLGVWMEERPVAGHGP